MCVLDFQRLGQALKFDSLIGENIYSPNKERKKETCLDHPHQGSLLKGQGEEVQGLFATSRYGMKEGEELEKTRRRMWELEFIQHFGKSGIFTGMMMSKKPCGCSTECWWAWFSSTFSHLKRNHLISSNDSSVERPHGWWRHSLFHVASLYNYLVSVWNALTWQGPMYFKVPNLLSRSEMVTAGVKGAVAHFIKVMKAVDKSQKYKPWG